MNKTILLAIILSLLAINVKAELNELIQQNVINSDNSYEQIFSTVEQVRIPSRLWIHLRTEKQMKLGEEIYQQLTKANLPGIDIEKKPIQLVNYGPRDSQLRYFNAKDEPNAKKLLEALRVLFPKLDIKDFSSEYSNIQWIKPGHFELWLSPDATIN